MMQCVHVRLKSHVFAYSTAAHVPCRMSLEEEEQGSGVRKVHAFIQESSVLIWDAQDVAYLRDKWRIVGGLIGALPSQPRQNAQLGLPLKLTSEETTLLIEMGILELLEYSPPTVRDEDIKAFEEAQKLDFEKQEQLYQERRERQRHDLGSKIHGSSSDATPSSPKRAKLTTTQVAGEAAGTKQKGSFSPMVTIPTVDSRPLLCHTHYDKWTFPATEMERLKYAVFHDLWLKGYYLTPGLKYGGDYLVYRDDPNRVHSDFIAVVMPWKQPISSIVSLGRLGSKVKKSTLLCSVEREGGPVNYVTLQWSGMA